MFAVINCQDFLAAGVANSSPRVLLSVFVVGFNMLVQLAQLLERLAAHFTPAKFRDNSEH